VRVLALGRERRKQRGTGLLDAGARDGDPLARSAKIAVVRARQSKRVIQSDLALGPHRTGARQNQHTRIALDRKLLPLHARSCMRDATDCRRVEPAFRGVVGVMPQRCTGFRQRH